MMDRYRRQSDRKQQSQLAHSRDRNGRGSKIGSSVQTAQGIRMDTSSRAGVSASSGSPSGLCNSCSYRAALSHSSTQLRVHLIRGLRRLFSNPLVGSALDSVINQLMATEFSRSIGDHPDNWSRQDIFFMALLDILMSDALISQASSNFLC